MPPLIARRYDEKGIPSIYSLNPHITAFHREANNGFSIGIYGLPISDKEIRNTNIDELLRKLSSTSE